MITSLRNWPLSRHCRSSIVTVIPPFNGGGGNWINLSRDRRATIWIWLSTYLTSALPLSTVAAQCPIFLYSSLQANQSQLDLCIHHFYYIFIRKIESWMIIFTWDDGRHLPVSQAPVSVSSPAGVWSAQRHGVGTFASTMAQRVDWSQFLCVLLWEEMYTTGATGIISPQLGGSHRVDDPTT